MMRKCTIAAFALTFGAIGVVPVAVAEADVSLYGSLRYGVEMADKDKSWVADDEEDAMWNLGSDRSSRWGIKGSMPAGEGLTAGFKMERAIGGVGSPSSMTARHHHVYLSGGFGTFTFGQQDAPYYGATTWDGAQTLGGATDFLFRSSGVSYASNLGGPFNFKVLFGSGKGGKETAEDGLNHIEASANFAAGPINMNLGYYDDSDMTVDGVKVHGMQRVGGTVGGNIGAINWKVGYNNGSDVVYDLEDDFDEDIEISGDDDRYGIHLGYAISDGGNIYTQYSERKFSGDVSSVQPTEMDGNLSSLLVGYSHVVAPGVVVYGEISNTDLVGKDGGVKVADVATNKAVVAMKITF